MNVGLRGFLFVLTLLTPVLLFPNPMLPADRGANLQSHDLLILTSVKGAQVAPMWQVPVKCDAAGNVYLQNRSEQVDAIHKLDGNGKEIAVFKSDLAKPGSQPPVGGRFSVGKDGYVYELVAPWDNIKRHILAYKPDGSLKSDITLEPGFGWSVAQAAVFPSGNFLVTGLKYDHPRTNWVKLPFTGIFGPDGSQLKEVKLEDDQMIHDMAVVGDSRVTAPESPGANYAVELGDIEAANDGNIYLMRRLSPAILYAISPQGEVVRRFTVDGGETGSMPESIHIAGDRIAVEFSGLIKTVDLEGRELASYVREKLPLEYPLGCYSINPERFTFLEGGDVDNPEVTLNVGAPK